MYSTHRTTTIWQAFFQQMQVIYYMTVRQVRAGHPSALMALVVSILQSLVLVVVFYGFFLIVGTRGVPLRGDFFVYLMTGVFLFMVHVKGIAGVAGSAQANSILMFAPTGLDAGDDQLRRT